MFFFAEYLVIFIVGAMAVILFLGAWYDPFGIVYALEKGGGLWSASVLGAGIFIVKAFTMVFLQMWLRWTLPRLRIDQVLYLCIKVLLPLAIMDLVGAAGWAWLVKPFPTFQMGVQILLAVVGAGGALYFAGLLARSVFSPRVGILRTILTPWNEVPLAPSPKAPAEPTPNG
jgi:hypothetical protein